MTVNDTRQEQLPPLVTDRSPELGRAPQPVPYYGLVSRSVTLDLAGAAGDAVPGDGDRCLLAIAIRKALPGWEAHVEGEYPSITRLRDGSQFPLGLAPELVAAIGRFDRGEAPDFGDVGEVTVSFNGSVDL